MEKVIHASQAKTYLIRINIDEQRILLILFPTSTINWRMFPNLLHIKSSPLSVFFCHTGFFPTLSSFSLDFKSIISIIDIPIPSLLNGPAFWEMLFITILAACALAAASHHEVPMDSEDPRHPEEKHQFSVATSPFDFFDKSQALPVTFTQGMRTPIDPGIKLEIEGKLVIKLCYIIPQVKYFSASTLILILPTGPILYYWVEEGNFRSLSEWDLAVGQKSPPEISPPNGVVDDRSYVIIMVSMQPVNIDPPIIQPFTQKVTLQFRSVLMARRHAPSFGYNQTLLRTRRMDRNQWFLGITRLPWQSIVSLSRRRARNIIAIRYCSLNSLQILRSPLNLTVGLARVPRQEYILMFEHSWLILACRNQ